MFVLLSSYTYQYLIRFKFVTRIYFVAQKNCVCRSETQAPIVDLVHVVVYEIHKYIASSAVRSLTNRNRLVVGRTYVLLLGHGRGKDFEISKKIDQ